MRTKKVMVSEKTNNSGIGDVRYDIKEGRIRARATVTLCNDTQEAAGDRRGRQPADGMVRIMMMYVA